METVGGIGPGALLAHRYLLGGVLGEGGMGRVYAATDLHTGGPVAVKVLHPSWTGTDAAIDQLRREARIAASLTSPRVVRVFDLATDPATRVMFLVQEYVAGRTLAEELDRQGTLPVAEALAIGAEIAAALEAAHTLGAVHRDLKPQNVMLVDGHVKVLDFGIARVLDDVARTSASRYVGTPTYSAPERAEGAGDIRADIYALGVILYELISGAVPFAGATAFAVFRRHAVEPPPSLPPAVPTPVRALVDRCLAKDPADRYQTPTALTTALNAVRRNLPPPVEAAALTSGSVTRTINFAAAPPDGERPRKPGLTRAMLVGVWSSRLRRLALPLAALVLLAMIVLFRDRDGQGEPAEVGIPTPTEGTAAQRAHLQFDGLDDYVEVPDNDAFSIATTGALTVAAWMRPDTLTFPKTESTGYVHWLGKGESRQQEWAFRMHSQGNRENRIAFYVFDLDGGTDGVGSYFQHPLTAGQWIHVVGVADGARTIIYKDGRQQDEDPYRGDPARPDLSLANGRAPVRLGKRNGPSHFQGGLAEVRIWNRALTGGEVAELHAANVVPRDGLVSEWLLGTDSGPIVPDTVGGHDGRLYR